MQLQTSDIIIIIIAVLAIILATLYFFGKKKYDKSMEAQSFIDQNKMVTSILIIDKKFERPTLKNLPKNMYEQLPKTARMRKMPIVKAKIGPQILTLITDKNVYSALPNKKTVKVEIAGAYIMNIVGLNLENKKKKSLGDRLSLYLSKKRNK